MPKIVNTALDLASSGLEIVAVYVTGAAPIAPICKLLLTLAPLASVAVRYFRKHTNKNGYNSEHK